MSDEAQQTGGGASNAFTGGEPITGRLEGALAPA